MFFPRRGKSSRLASTAGGSGVAIRAAPDRSASGNLSNRDSLKRAWLALAVAPFMRLVLFVVWVQVFKEGRPTPTPRAAKRLPRGWRLGGLRSVPARAGIDR